MARVCSNVIEDLAAEGLKVALLRPISLYPFPSKAIREAARKGRHVLVVELSGGQMIEDVQQAVRGERPIHFYNRMGGMLASPEEVADKVRQILAGTSQEVCDD